MYAQGHLGDSLAVGLAGLEVVLEVLWRAELLAAQRGQVGHAAQRRARAPLRRPRRQPRQPRLQLPHAFVTQPAVAAVQATIDDN